MPSSLADTLVEPAFCSIPPYAKTLGPEVVDLCCMAGFPPDPEQVLALDAIFGVRPDGKAASVESAVVACRQNIKTGLFKQCVLGWLFITDQRLVIWSAHEFRASQEAHRDLTELLEGSDFLRRRVKAIHRGNGDEGIELLTGQRTLFKARTSTGGRSLSSDRLVMDEAFALQPAHMGSLWPLMSARPDPQIVYGSSAGLQGSAVLRAIRDRGRPGTDPRLTYLEWCDDLPGECGMLDCDHAVGRPSCRLDDERRWRRANSQAGRRITMEYIAIERRAMPPHEFGRERLGWWDEDPSEGSVFDLEGWGRLADPASQIVGAPMFALDCPQDLSLTTIAAAGRGSDRSMHVEVIDRRSGTGWVVARAKELQDRHVGSGVVIDPGAPAGSLLADLRDADVTVFECSARAYAQACGSFLSGTRPTKREGLPDAPPTVRHLGQPELDQALAGCSTRPLGDAYAWNRRHPRVDITPLVAVTLAAWGFTVHGAVDMAGQIW